MCIAILSPEGKTISKETLAQCYKRNSDGAGYMYASNNMLHVHKGFFSFDEFYDSYKPVEKEKCVIHFRIKTHGDINADNTHPFNVSNELAFVHNGMINIHESHKQYSDTWHFNERIIKPMYKDNKAFIKKIYNQELIRGFIGNSKLIFLDNKGRSTIINPEKGIWENGVWYSNSSYVIPKEMIPYKGKPTYHGTSTYFLEGEMVRFTRDFQQFKKGTVAYVDNVLPFNKLELVTHEHLNGSVIERKSTVPAVFVESVDAYLESDYVESRANFYM
jgi:hypothetical protein